MACFPSQSNYQSGRYAAVSTVTLAGLVRNIDNQAVTRIVVAFGANNLAAPLGITTSSPTTGEFSFVLAGTESTEFACVVQGERGENCVVHSHKTVG